jgi:hypothetical protein
LATISPEQGWVYHEVVDHAVNAERALLYLQALRAHVDQVFAHDQNVLLVLDNARFHREEDLAATFGVPTRRHRFLPPYSPFLNPIEEAFNCFKSAVKHELRMRRDEVLGIQQLPWGQKSARRREVLAAVLPLCVPVVTVAKCVGFYAHSVSFYPACLAQSDIL